MPRNGLASTNSISIAIINIIVIMVNIIMLGRV